MDLISVIVPVYRTEAYLDRCIQSIVDQSYGNMEIILVDDGSPDRCPEICDAWALKDRRIKVIHQKNQGGGAARNAALNVAKGSFIAFVDSDDYISSGMYEHLLSLLEQGAEIAECGYTQVTEEAAVFEESGFKTQWVSAEEAMRLHIWDAAFRQLIWNKLYRREVMDGVRFPEGKKIDDEFFTYRVLGNARTLVRSDRICYAYCQQADSVMHSIDARKRLEAVEARELRHQYIVQHFPALAGESRKNLWFTCMFYGQLAIGTLSGQEAGKALRYLSEVLKKYPFASRELDACSIKEKLWLTMARFSLGWTCRIRNRIKVGT